MSLLDTGIWLQLLLDATIRGSILMLLALLTSRAVRSWSASLRHRIWSLLITALLSQPLLSLALPWAGLALPLRVLPPEVSTISPSLQSSQGGSTLSLLLITVWATGATVVLLRLVLGLLNVWRLTRRAHPLTDDWTVLMEEAKTSLALSRHVSLRLTSSRILPLTWSICPPVVLLPADALQWSVPQKKAVLLHELAHIKRHDWVWQLLASLTCALYWFNPLAWFAARYLRNEGEAATDMHALQGNLKPSEYAQTLLELARSRRDGLHLPFATTMGTTMGRWSLEHRLTRILQREARPAPTRPVAACLLGMAGAVALLLAAVQLEPQHFVQAVQHRHPYEGASRLLGELEVHPLQAGILTDAEAANWSYQAHVLTLWTQAPTRVDLSPQFAVWLIYDPSEDTLKLMLHPRPTVDRQHPRYRM